MCAFLMVLLIVAAPPGASERQGEANAILENSEPKEKKAKMVTILISTHDDKNYPRGSLMVRVMPNGELRGMLSHEFSDEDLVEALKKRGVGGDETDNKRVIHVQIDEEESTSISQLTKAVNRLKAAADPTKETILVVSLSDPAAPRK